MENTSKKENRLLDQVKHIANTIESGEYETDNEDGPNGFDYLEDALDIQYIVSSDKKYLGARVLVAFGGPNIWINTQKQMIEGHWWSESEFAYYQQDNLDLDSALEEIYNCS
tara:strand:- start:307 stop:642 length:336 start_codon:yes stop_codon:yes gene_type:complete